MNVAFSFLLLLVSYIYFTDLSESLDLSTNALSGPLPVDLASLVSLSKLSRLSETFFYSPVYLSLLALWPTANLDMSNNQFSGALFSEIGLMGNLDRLALSGNFLSGSLPTEVGALALIRKFVFICCDLAESRQNFSLYTCDYRRIEY